MRLSGLKYGENIRLVVVTKIKPCTVKIVKSAQTKKLENMGGGQSQARVVNAGENRAQLEWKVFGSSYG